MTSTLPIRRPPDWTDAEEQRNTCRRKRAFASPARAADVIVELIQKGKREAGGGHAC